MTEHIRERRQLVHELRKEAKGYKPVWDGETSNYSLCWDWPSSSWKFYVWISVDTCPASVYFAKKDETLIDRYSDRLHLLRDVEG